MFSVSTSTISLVAALDMKLVARKPSLLILRAILMAKERLAACLSRPCNGIPLNAIHSWSGRIGIGLQGRDKQAANRSFAINIARKISREGLRATNFMSNAATKEMVDVLTVNIAEVLGKSISVATVR